MAPGSWQEKEIQVKFCQMLAQPTRWQTLASASKFTFSNELDTLCEIPHYVALELSQGQWTSLVVWSLGVILYTGQ